MKRIENPGMGKIALVLIPPLMLLFFPSVLGEYNVVATAIYIACLAVFAGLSAYYCLRKKCYAQLAIATMITAILIGALIFIHSIPLHLTT